MLTEIQTQALSALRNADDSKRLQGLAFKDGRMCACVVVVNGIYPGLIDVNAHSYAKDSDVNKVYNTIKALIGESYQQLINYNDKLDDRADGPKYTFAQIADQMEAWWTQ